MQWLLLMSLALRAWSEEALLVYQERSGCRHDEFYDVSSLSCVQCATNESFVPSKDGFSCTCNAHSRALYSNSTSGARARCEACRPSELVSRARAACVPRRCVQRERGQSSCLVCSNNQISVTENPDGTPLKEVKCITCKPGYRPSQDKTSCQPCSLISEGKINSCACNHKTEDLIRGACVPKAFVKLRDEYKQKATSIWEHNHFYDLLKLEFLCTKQDETACRALAHLCALSFFDWERNGPCRLWTETAPPPGLPKLKYGENEAYSVLNQQTVPASFRFTGDEKRSELKVSMAAHSRDGGSVRFMRAASEWGSLCPCGKNPPSSLTFRLGYNYRHLCKVTAKEILSQDRPDIIAPYLLYKNSTNSSEKLHPVAVAIKLEGNDYMKTSDRKNLKLFHRFFLLNKWSEAPSNQSERRSVLAWYLRSATLKIKIEYGSRDHTNKIYTPLLMLEYGSLRPADLASEETITLSFALLNEMGGNTFIHSMEIAVGALAGVAVLFSLLQAWGLSRRSACTPTLAALYFFLFACGNLSNVLFLVALGASLHSLVLFHWQRVVHTLPPTLKEQLFLEAFVLSAFALKVVEVAWLNWKQSRVDVFLLDWLTPHLSTGAIRYETERDSEWRKLLVARHWCRIQTDRRVSPVVCILISILILELIIRESSASLVESASFRCALSGGVLACVHCALAALAWCARKYRAPVQLADLCAAANVSVLVFEDELYAHYVHGRTVEASGAGAGGGERVPLQGRGLLPDQPHQAFSICCDTNFRLIYKRLSEGLVSTELQSGRAFSTAHLTNKAESLETIEELGRRMLRDPKQHSQALLTKYLASFIDQALEGSAWSVRERTALSRLLDVELGPRPQPGVSTLLKDAQPDTQSYRAVLWCGAEWSLATFDLYLFSFAQLLSGSHLLAGLVVLCTWKVMQLSRHEAGRRNFLKKTNMDSSFVD